MRRSRLPQTPVAIAIVLGLLFATPAVADTEAFPGSCWFYLHSGDFDCDFIVPGCYSVQSAMLYFLLHPDACTNVVADVFVDSTYLGSTGMLNACQESPHYDVTTFLADGSARVSLRNPRCAPGYGCCGASDSTVVTWGGYVYLLGNMTTVSVRDYDQMDITSRLDVYPNPLAGTVSYTITIEHPCRVRLELFDAAGRLVEALLDRDLAAGHHLYSWQTAGSSRRHIPAGMYVLRLRAGDHGETKKLAILP